MDSQSAHGDTLHNDCFPDLKDDFIFANPPFNDPHSFGKLDDVRWQFYR